MRFLLLNKDVAKTALWFNVPLALWLILFFNNVNIDTPENFLASLLNPGNILLAIFTVISFFKAVKFWFYWCDAAAYIKSIARGDYITTHGGRPRSGKTATCLYQYIILCFLSFYQLQYEYKKLLERKERHDAMPNLVKWTEDDEINLKQDTKAYKRAVMNIDKRIPCSLSIIRITCKWRKHNLESNPFTPKMAAGKENIPRYSVVFCDEEDKTYHQELFRYDDGNVKNQFKYAGQEEVTYIGNAQNPMKVYNEMRGCTFYNEIHESQKAVCKPFLPTLIYKQLKWIKSRYIDRVRFSNKEAALKVQAKGLTRFLYRYEKWLSGFGFRSMRTVYTANTEVSATTTKVGKHRYTLIANLIGKYDQCACSELFPAADLEPEEHEWPTNSYKVTVENNFNDKLLEEMKEAANEEKLKQQMKNTRRKEYNKAYARAGAKKAAEAQNKKSSSAT